MHRYRIWPLDDHIDLTGLEALHLNICSGIAKSNRDYSTRIIPHHEATGDVRAAIDFKNKEESRIAAVRSDPTSILLPAELELYNSLDYNQKRVFLELYKGAYNDGEFVRIRFTKKEHLQDKYATFYSNTTETTENTKFFTPLMEWIDNLPFIDVGRVLIIVTKHHLAGDLHYDRRDDWLDGRHHFLWLNPFNQKKFSVFDGYTEIPISHKAMFFDTGCIHGARVNDVTTYTIRIDGQFSEDFCKRTNIPWSPR